MLYMINNKNLTPHIEQILWFILKKTNNWIFNKNKSVPVLYS